MRQHRQHRQSLTLDADDDTKHALVRRDPWTEDEDDNLLNCVNSGMTKWLEMAAKIPGRNGQQCRNRWLDHLDPSINIGPWSEQEDNALVDAHDDLGNCWSEIAVRVPGRSDAQVR
jgi:hypothetical protein